MPEASAGPLWKRILRRFLQILLALVFLVVVFHLIMWPLALWKEKSAAKRWTDAGYPLDDYLEKIPVRENSAIAEKLCVAANKLGLNLRSNDPNATENKKDTPPEAEKEWMQAKEAIKSYGVSFLESPEPGVELPPEALATYLKNHSSDLAEVRSVLLGAEPLRWVQHIERGFNAPIPNFLGQIELTRVLVSDALAAKASGDNARALANMEAAWKLSEGISDRVELISQLILIAERKMVIVTLRKLDGVPEAWQRRLAEWDPLKDMERSYATEAALMGTVKDMGSLEMMGAKNLIFSRVGVFCLKPYVRLCAAGAQELELDEVQEILALGPCPTDESYNKVGENQSKKIPAWNIFARVALPSLFSSWARVKHARIQAELTQKVLALKAQRAVSGYWPAAPEGIEKSFCPKEQWSYTAGQDGSMSLSFSGPPASKDVIKGYHPPQEYKEGPETATPQGE